MFSVIDVLSSQQPLLICVDFVFFSVIVLQHHQINLIFRQTVKNSVNIFAVIVCLIILILQCSFGITFLIEL